MFLTVLVGLFVCLTDYSKEMNGFAISFPQGCFSGQKTIDSILGMIRITILMQDPH